MIQEVFIDSSGQQAERAYYLEVHNDLRVLLVKILMIL